LAIIGIPEAVFTVTAVVLWRKKRPMAAGILLAAMILITHMIVHMVSHG
jgi:hypothetical protein